MPSAIIVGAGIGGLTAALALAARGIGVTLVERRTGFGEAGAGIQLSPNASRILIDLGLGPALRRAASEPERVRVRGLTSGQTIGEIALGAGMRERFGAPYLVIHRAALQTILLDQVRGRSNIRLLLGRTAVGAIDEADRAAVAIEGTSGGPETLVADLMIGADGVWSATRAALGDRREPRDRGFVAWRATIPLAAAPAGLDLDTTGLWLGRAGHVVHYPAGGGGLLNVVAIERGAGPVEGWSAPGDPAELLRVFAKAAPPLSSLLATLSEWRRWSLHELPAKTMARGRLALVGDAAHPVLPFLAQGGALAIEDAAVLASLLARSPDDIRGALAAYAASRLPRVRRVQAHARRNVRAYHASGPIALARDLVMRRLGAAGMTERYAWIYGWLPPA